MSLSHCFDMHGGRARKDGTNIAGTLIEIHNNTFRALPRSIAICGVPQKRCEIHHNWFLKHGSAKRAVLSFGNTRIANNLYGDKPKAVK